MKNKQIFLSAIMVLFVVISWLCETTFAGSLVAWGNNDYGQINVPAGNDFVAIAAGYSQHSLALKSNGLLVGWGNNEYGQINIPSGFEFTVITAGTAHNLAIKADGSLIGWGRNNHGQVDVPDGNDFVAIAAGRYHSLALRCDGSLIAWGNNDYGQCDVPSGNNFVAIAAASGGWHNLALKSDGSIVGWGDNRYGQAEAPKGNDFTAITAGKWFNLALKADKSLVGWGNNLYGQTDVPDGNDFLAIAAGFGHGLAIKTDGSLVGWGYNDHGETNVPLGNNFVAISAGYNHSLALVSEPPEPNIVVFPLSHDFGDVELGTSSTLIVTISNLGNCNLNISGIALETDFAITSVPPSSIVVEPNDTVDVEITYTPTVLGYNSAILKITSDDPDEAVVEVQLGAVGIEIPPPPSEQITNILAFFDESVENGTLEGRGCLPGVAAFRLRALRCMIKAASDLIEGQWYELACGQLRLIYWRCDGQPWPPDFVKGEAVLELANMIKNIMTSLGCESSL